MIDGTRKRRQTCLTALAENFESITCLIGKTVWQDEKDFTVDISSNPQNAHVDGNSHMYLIIIYSHRQMIGKRNVSNK